LFNGFLKAQEIPDDTVKVSLEYQNAALSQVLTDIMSQVKKTFIYRNDDIKGYRVTINLVKVPLKTALEDVLETTGLEYEVLTDGGIAIVNVGIRSIFISGSVEDEGTGRRLSGADIIIAGSKQGAVSDEFGRFKLIVKSAGTVKLIVRYMGYAPRKILITNRKVKLRIIMRKTVVSGHGVTVTASRAAMSSNGGQPLSEISIAPLRVLSWPGLGDADAVKALQWAAGVHGSNDGMSGLSIRGGESGENLVLLDGIPIHQPDHLMGLVSAFSSEALYAIRLLKGGVPARFGGCTSGVVECTSQSGASKSINIRGRFSSLCMQGDIAAPIGKKMSMFVSFRNTYQATINQTLRNNFRNFLRQSEDQKIEIVPDSSGKGSDLNFGFYDVNAKLSWLPTEKDVVALSVYKGGDQLNQDQTYTLNIPKDTLTGTTKGLKTTVLDQAEWKNFGASLTWNHSEGANSLVVLAATSRTNRLYVEGETKDKKENSWHKNHQNGIDEDRVDIDYSMQYNEALAFEVGFRLQNFKTRHDVGEREQRIAIASSNVNALLGAGYAEARLNSPGWQLRTGGRLSYYTPLNKYFIEPRIAIERSITARISISAAWGRYYQFVNRVENGGLLSSNQSFWLQAGPNLKPSYAEHLIGGLTWDHAGWNAGMEIYFKKLAGTTILAQQSDYSSIINDRIYQGFGRSQGLEFFIHKLKGKTNFWLNYTLSSTWQKFTGLNNGKSFFANQDRRHAFKAVYTWSHADWTLGGTCLWTSGLPYTKVYNYQLEPFPGLKRKAYRNGPRNAERLPEILRMDVSLSRRMQIRNISCDIGISVYNIMNKKNLLRRRFVSISDNVRARDTKMMGIMPSFFVRFAWGE